MKFRAPAKVNLSLRVLGKRPDGFHEIESLMTPVSIYDEITIKTGLGNRIHVTCDHPDLPQGGENLATKAAKAFYQHTGLRFETEISIRKHIPHGAGLGGGSSDAATVLIALDSIFETHLGAGKLEELAAGIGSDVPFFIRRKPAWVRGRGEIIESTELSEPLPLLLVKPPFPVETPRAYAHWAESEMIPGVSYDPQNVRNLEMVNDLERPAFEKFLLLPVIKSWLIEQPEVEAALMSGSGSTIFAVCRSPEDARHVRKRARERFGADFWLCPCEAPA